MIKYKEIFEWIKPIFIVFFLAGAIFYSTGFAAVNGDSMNPVLKDKQYFLINKLAYKNSHPERYDIIVFKSHLTDVNGNRKKLIKRVIGLPGDEVKIKDGEAYINENILDEDMYFLVPEGKVFVMGDNRDISMDSRNESVGYIDFDEVYGKLWIKIFPFGG